MRLMKPPLKDSLFLNNLDGMVTNPVWVLFLQSLGTTASVAAAINPTAFYIDGDSPQESAGMAVGDCAFYAGAYYENRTSAPFRVYTNGLLIAENASIYGSVRAEDGHIGNWFIEGDYIYSLGLGTVDTNPGNGIILDSNGKTICVYEGVNKRIQLGHISGNAYGLMGYNADGDTIIEITGYTTTIAGWDISPTSLSSTSEGNTTILSSENVAFAAGPTGAPSCYITRAGVLTATNAVISGNISATNGEIAGWQIDTNGLRSAGVDNARILLDKTNMRVSVLDAANFTKVAMGYLGGLIKHGGLGYWEAGDYGFWASQGDKLVIDGDVEYKSGDWLIAADGSLLIKTAADKTIIRLGTAGGEKGLFLYSEDEIPFIRLTYSGLRCLTPGAGGKYGNSVKYGTAKYGAAVRASINNSATSVPFECSANSIYGDYRYYNRSADPIGPAVIGDTCVVNGVHKTCTVAGTPGTWTVTGTQS